MVVLIFLTVFFNFEILISLSISHYNFDLFFRGTTSFTRRSCQTVLAAHLLSIVRVVAPILPHLAEDVWQNLPFDYTTEDDYSAKFVFDSKWPAFNERWLSFSSENIEFWEYILEVVNFLPLQLMIPN